jgi:hypothetical protein
MEHGDESLLRDADLLEQLEKAPPGQFYKMYVTTLVQEQKKRDTARTVAEARKAELAALPREQRRRAIAREVIENEGPSSSNLRYMPTSLAICGLPYKALPEGQYEFERSQGRMAVTVTAGKLRSPDGRRVQQPIPYGPKARLIMAHLASEAKRSNSPIVETSESLSGFMRDMGFEPRGGRNGNIDPFKDQLRALAACRMEISSWDGKRSGQIDVKPLQKVELWFADEPGQRSLWPSRIAFSPDFFEEIRDHSLPIDVRVLRALSNSARRLDLMMWITFRITRLKTHLVLPWHAMREQFGEGYARERAFKEAFKEDVAVLKELFPKLPLQLTERGLEMDYADKLTLSIPTASSK